MGGCRGSWVDVGVHRWMLGWMGSCRGSWVDVWVGGWV